MIEGNEKGIEVPKWVWLIIVLVVAGLVVSTIFGWVGHADLARQAKEYRRELATGRETIGDLKTTLERAGTDIRELEIELESSRKAINSLETKLDKLKEKLDEANEYIGELERTNTALRESSDLANKYIGSARSELRGLIEELSKENNR